MAPDAVNVLRRISLSLIMENWVVLWVSVREVIIR